MFLFTVRSSPIVERIGESFFLYLSGARTWVHLSVQLRLTERYVKLDSVSFGGTLFQYTVAT